LLYAQTTEVYWISLALPKGIPNGKQHTAPLCRN